ncbi:MAG: DNA adenine methylase, partial [Neisseriaceae bacterium]|nr:DNA adenine methylase [Neisseriaceae bacterium]
NLLEKVTMFYYLDFINFDTSYLQENDFIYIDPPYLITCATYNENGAWSIKDEMYLLDFIDFINSKNIRFALSNVLYSKGKKNDILENWINKNKYQTNYLTYNYSNSNWQTKDRTHSTQEVLITNYHIN